jgi:hypothetical protein
MVIATDYNLFNGPEDCIDAPVSCLKPTEVEMLDAVSAVPCRDQISCRCAQLPAD